MDAGRGADAGRGLKDCNVDSVQLLKYISISICFIGFFTDLG
jgi:hypothetical protein